MRTLASVSFSLMTWFGAAQIPTRKDIAVIKDTGTLDVMDMALLGQLSMLWRVT
jgi:hypothetical protein